MRQDGGFEARRQLGDGGVLLLLEKLQKALHLDFDVFVGVLAPDGRGRPHEVALERLGAGALHPRDEVVHQGGELVRRDVPLLHLLLEDLPESVKRLVHQPLDLLLGEVAVGHSRADDLADRDLEVVASDEMETPPVMHGVVDTLVDDVGERVAEELLVEVFAALKRINGRLDVLDEAVDELSGAAVLGVSAVAGRPALAVLQLKRRHELFLHELLDLVQRGRFLLAHVLRHVGEVLHDEAPREVVDGCLAFEESLHRNDAACDLLDLGRLYGRVLHDRIRDIRVDVYKFLGGPQVLHGPLQDAVVLFFQRLDGNGVLLRIRGALHEFLRQLDEILEVEVRVDRRFQLGRIVARVGAGVRDAVAHVERKHLLEKHFDLGGVLDAVQRKEVRQARAHVGKKLAAALALQVEAEGVALLERRARKVLEAVVDSDAHLRRLQEALQLHDDRAELHLVLDHAIALRLLAGRVFDFAAELFEGVCAKPVVVELQVVALERLKVAPEVGLLHRRLEEVVQYALASARGVVYLVELLEGGHDLAPREGLARLHLAFVVLGREDHVADSGAGLFEGVLEVAAQGGGELLAHGAVVRGRGVRAPRKRQVYLAVELLELQAAVRAQGKADIPLVLQILVVDHLAKVIYRIGRSVCVQLLN